MLHFDIFDAHVVLNLTLILDKYYANFSLYFVAKLDQIWC